MQQATLSRDLRKPQLTRDRADTTYRHRPMMQKAVSDVKQTQIYDVKQDSLEEQKNYSEESNGSFNVKDQKVNDFAPELYVIRPRALTFDATNQHFVNASPVK